MKPERRQSVLMPEQSTERRRPDQPDRVFAEFIERMGMSAQGDGLPRIAGRMMAWFVLNGGPISLTDLAQALSISKASASTNARLLVGLGVLERSARTEGRKDFYQLSANGYARLLQGYIDRMQERLDLIETLVPAIPADRDDVSRRVGDMRDFYSQAIDTTQELVARLERD